MDKGRRTSSIIEKFVYDPVTQSLNVSFQDLEYNVESGEMGFFEKDGDICYVSKLEIASSGEKPYTVKFTNGDVFGSATVDGAVEFIENEGGGGGGGTASVVFEWDEDDDGNEVLKGATPEEVKAGIENGASFSSKYFESGEPSTAFLDAFSEVVMKWDELPPQYGGGTEYSLKVTYPEVSGTSASLVVSDEFYWDAENEWWVVPSNGGN